RRRLFQRYRSGAALPSLSLPTGLPQPPDMLRMGAYHDGVAPQGTAPEAVRIGGCPRTSSPPARKLALAAALEKLRRVASGYSVHLARCRSVIMNFLHALDRT